MDTKNCSDNVWYRCDNFQMLSDKNSVKICIDDKLLTMMCGMVKGQRHPGYTFGLEKTLPFCYCAACNWALIWFLNILVLKFLLE